MVQNFPLNSGDMIQNSKAGVAGIMILTKGSFEGGKELAQICLDFPVKTRQLLAKGF